MPEQIETQRLVLRKPRRDDANAIFTGWGQDKEVTRYLTWRPHQQIGQTDEFLQGCLSAWEHETRFPYLITLRETGDVIGMIDLEKVGMQCEGILRKYIIRPNISNVPRDSYMYAIVKQ